MENEAEVTLVEIRRIDSVTVTVIEVEFEVRAKNPKSRLKWKCVKNH